MSLSVTRRPALAQAMAMPAAHGPRANDRDRLDIGYPRVFRKARHFGDVPLSEKRVDERPRLIRTHALERDRALAAAPLVERQRHGRFDRLDGLPAAPFDGAACFAPSRGPSQRAARSIQPSPACRLGRGFWDAACRGARRPAQTRRRPSSDRLRSPDRQVRLAARPRRQSACRTRTSRWLSRRPRVASAAACLLPLE